MKIPKLFFLILLATFCAGCYSIEDGIDEFAAEQITAHRARQSWSQMDTVYCDLPYGSHFRDGYLAGFTSVVGGGSPCAPTLPPRKYWGVWYQNESGHGKTRAWFDGFAHGALAAEQEMGTGYGSLPISSTGQQWSPGHTEHEVIPSAPPAPVPLNHPDFSQPPLLQE